MIALKRRSAKGEQRCHPTHGRTAGAKVARRWKMAGLDLGSSLVSRSDHVLGTHKLAQEAQATGREGPGTHSVQAPKACGARAAPGWSRRRKCLDETRYWSALYAPHMRRLTSRQASRSTGTNRWGLAHGDGVVTVELVHRGSGRGCGQLALALGAHEPIAQSNDDRGGDIDPTEPVVRRVAPHGLGRLDHLHRVILPEFGPLPVVLRALYPPAQQLFRPKPCVTVKRNDPSEAGPKVLAWWRPRADGRGKVQLAKDLSFLAIGRSPLDLTRQ